MPAAARTAARRWLPPLIVAAWACATAYGFWWFGVKDRRALDAPAVAAWFDATHHAPAAERWLREAVARTVPAMPGTAATVIALEAPGCSCNRAAVRHVERIADAYRPRGVRFATARLGEAGPGGLVVPAWASAAPAALVFDADGRLVYFGPLSDEGSCGAARTGFVERALDAMLAPAGAPGATVAGAAQPLLGVGCFCVRTTTA